MSTKTPSQKPDEEVPAHRALLFELEGTVVPIRETVFATLKAQVKSETQPMTLPQFGKCGLHANPAHVVAAVRAEYKLKPAALETLTRKLNEALQGTYTSAKGLPKGFEPLLKAATRSGCTLAAISYQSEEQANALLERTGLTALGAKVFCYTETDREFPRADIWLKTVRALGMSPTRCIAMVRTAVAAKTALAASLRCISIPDEYTTFQDFSGSDVIADDFESPDLKHLFA